MIPLQELTLQNRLRCERIAHGITSPVHTSPILRNPLNISSINRQPLPPVSDHNSSASCLVSCKFLEHPTLRLARYITFALNPVGPPIPSNAIICLLADRGQVAPRNPSKVRDERENARTPSEQESMLICAHCNLLIPFADLARFTAVSLPQTPHSAVSLTEELLSQMLAPLHMDGCSGRIGGAILGEDNDTLFVTESQTPFALPSDLTKLLGMRLYCYRFHVPEL